MRLLLKRALFTCLLISCALHLRGQDLRQTTSLANYYHESGNIDEAVRLYQRVAFFSDEDESIVKAYIRIADHFEGLDSLQKANAYLQLAYNVTVDEAEKGRLAIRRAENLILQRLYFEAQEELLSVWTDDGELAKDIQLYMAIAQFGSGNYNESEKLFIEYAGEEKREAIENLFQKNDRISKLNPNTARFLSMAVPGAGQVYAGDYRNGINSLLLSAFFGWLFIYTATHNGFVDAALSVVPWYYRYYSGGYNRAEAIAEEQRAIRRARIYRDLIHIVQT